MLDVFIINVMNLSFEQILSLDKCIRHYDEQHSKQKAVEIHHVLLIFLGVVFINVHNFERH